jgi:hypothetical protein
MATKQKNIPPLADLKRTFIYIDNTTSGGMLADFAGRLYPADLFHGKSIKGVRNILEEFSDLFCGMQDATRYIKIKSLRIPEEKLVWYYHTGKFPQNAIEHKNNNLTDNRYENLRLSNGMRRSTSTIRSARNMPNAKPASGVVGIYYTTSQYNAYMWKVEYVTNVVVEVPCDEDGNVIDWKSKGWHNRKTKMAHKRVKTFIGFYLTLEEAKRALRLHTNEVKYGVCRWHTDNKIKTLCHMISNQKDGLYTYLNMLSYREILPLETVSDIADKLGYASRPLQVKTES